jgi:integrase/recombinase XerC
MPTVSDLIAGYLLHLSDERDCSEGTVITYGGILRRMDAEMPFGLATATAEELMHWINAGRRSKATRSLYRTAAASFFTWACDPRDPHLDFDPTLLIPAVRVPHRSARPAAEDVVTDILARADRPYRDWFTLASFGGLRCIEIAALDREDVTETSMRLLGKGDKERTVPTHPLVWRAVADLPPGPVARNRDGGPTTRLHVTRRANRYLHDVLGCTISMHQLRHRFATAVYEASGFDLRVTQELLGHASVATTQTYVAVTAPARARAVLGLRAAA